MRLCYAEQEDGVYFGVSVVVDVGGGTAGLHLLMT